MTTQPPDTADRVERLEASAFRAGQELAEIKARLDTLPERVRREILNYTAPVLGEIMAGRATLATRQDIEALALRLADIERRLTEKIDGQFGTVQSRLDNILAALNKQG